MITSVLFETAHELFPKTPEGELGLSKAGWIALHAILSANGGPTIQENWNVLAANTTEVSGIGLRSARWAFRVFKRSKTGPRVDCAEPDPASATRLCSSPSISKRLPAKSAT